MKLITKFLMTCLLATATSCTIDSNGLLENTDVLTEPWGTATANIIHASYSIVVTTNEGYYGSIGWIDPGNFYFFSNNSNVNVSICDVGRIRGVVDITEIPTKGFTEPKNNKAILIDGKVGHGYVLKFTCDGASDVYVRMYVVRPTINRIKRKGVEVRYQYPFEP